PICCRVRFPPLHHRGFAWRPEAAREPRYLKASRSMAEPVEVAIESALLTRAQAFATAQSLTIALPNVAFTAPVATPTAHYLEAHFLPAPTNGLGLSTDSTNQLYGIFQISVYCGLGGGELAPGRIASAALSYFKFGTFV